MARLGILEGSENRGFGYEKGAGCDGFTGLWNGR